MMMMMMHCNYCTTMTKKEYIKIPTYRCLIRLSSSEVFMLKEPLLPAPVSMRLSMSTKQADTMSQSHRVEPTWLQTSFKSCGNDGFGFARSQPSHQQFTNSNRGSGSTTLIMEKSLRLNESAKLRVSAVPTVDIVASEDGLSKGSDLGKSSYFADISFQNLGLQLKSGEKRVVLEGVTGQLLHGRVCAVMGPSGAGKTTFLTALCGKASYGTLSGQVYINGQQGLLTDQK